MCGATAEDWYDTHPSRKKHLQLQVRFGDPSRKWLVCDECHEGLEGLQNTSPPKPDRIHLLGQVRRATIDDQQAVLEWLLGKFGLQASKPGS